MEVLSFYLDNVLRPVFEDSPKQRHNDLARELDEHEARTSGNNNQADLDNRSVANSEPSIRGSRRAKDSIRKNPEDILDLDGPKLIVGCRLWIIFYQIIGQLNWLGVPFYLSIIYKFLIMALTGYMSFKYFLEEFLKLSVIDLTYRNPIFIFIGFLALTSTGLNVIMAFETNLFKLCPLFKVLTTPKLCFISEEVQQIIGSRTVSWFFIFHAYNSILLLLMVHTDFNDFIQHFNLFRFLVFLICSICGTYYLIGMQHLDFYVRACFASWLIALKGNLEQRFAHLHRHQRLQRMRQQRALISASALDDVELDAATTATHLDRSSSSLSTTIETIQERQTKLDDELRAEYKIVTLDEIQKNLNTMDDHLEVLRSIQTSSLVMITLNAFLTNGALLLFAYNLLANRGNYYHGLLSILLVTSYTIIVFFSYIGDSWLYYALSSFVQSVEDEYFLQGGDIGAATSDALVAASQQRLVGADHSGELMREHQLLLIKKKDVLFCREFLHQFENHLATPWSKLTVKVHLRMVGTFVTLIAAQIIFDHEH